MSHFAALLNLRSLDKILQAMAAGDQSASSELSSEERELLRLLQDGASSPAATTWSLKAPPVFVYRCGACGGYWLHPRTCCGERTRRTHLSYYLPSVSEFSTTAPEFSVVMLTKDNLHLTQEAVESLRRACGNHLVEFVFVDCCSRDGSLNYFRGLARKESVQVIVTHPEESFIYSRNCNRGAQVARGRFLLFANNDIHVCDPELFSKLARALEDPRVGVVGTLTDKGSTNELQSQQSLAEESVWSIKPVMGFLWGVRAELFAELGGMDESFCDYGCDEIDFQYRAIRRNYRIAIVDSQVHHQILATFGPNIFPSLMRNVARFDAKHGCRLFHQGEWYWPFLVHPYPRISVAIACRNHGDYLPRAIESALANPLPFGTTLQVVVVNDASTDETAGVLEQHQHQYPEQVNGIHRSLSRGPAVAKNQAIARCIGEYVALLDADDEFLAEKLSRSIQRLDATGADFLYHDFELAFPGGYCQPQHLGEWSVRRWRKGKDLPTCTWVFRRGTVTFNEAYVTGEDPEFLRRRWSTLKTTYLPEVLARYNLHAGSLSTRAMCQVVTGQLKGLPGVSVAGCDVGTPLSISSGSKQDANRSASPVAS